jgi:hypothetical protein
MSQDAIQHHFDRLTLRDLELWRFISDVQTVATETARDLKTMAVASSVPPPPTMTSPDAILLQRVATLEARLLDMENKQGVVPSPSRPLPPAMVEFLKRHQDNPTAKGTCEDILHTYRLPRGCDIVVCIMAIVFFATLAGNAWATESWEVRVFLTIILLMTLVWTTSMLMHNRKLFEAAAHGVEALEDFAGVGAVGEKK